MISEERILKLKKIAVLIINRKRHHLKLNRYEYYMLGGIPFRKGESTLRELLSAHKINTFEFNILYRYIENELVLGASRNKEFILNTHYQFGNRVLTLEEKLSIWMNLYNLGLTDNNIDDLVFSAAVREYAKENGLIPNKKLIRRK